jgi:hypothetical protein
MPLPERREPTHVLQIEVPLYLDEAKREGWAYDPVKQALEIALSSSRAAYDGVICNDVQVTMVEQG